MEQQRTVKKHAQQHEGNGKKVEASFEPQAIAGKDRTKVAVLAYGLYEQRGREDGHDLDDWLEAEQRIGSRGEGRGGDRGF